MEEFCALKAPEKKTETKTLMPNDVPLLIIAQHVAQISKDRRVNGHSTHCAVMCHTVHVLNVTIHIYTL